MTASSSREAWREGKTVNPALEAIWYDTVRKELRWNLPPVRKSERKVSNADTQA